jgi:hypothetical protein
MYNVTSAFKTAIVQPSRHLKSRITLGENIITDEYIQSITWDCSIIPGDNFEVGTAPMSTVEIELFDKDGSLTYQFEDSEIKIELAAELSDGTYEYVPFGLFTIEESTKDKKKIKLTGCDRMYKFEKDYVSTLVYPATLGQIAQDICNKAGVNLSTISFPNSTYSVPSKPVLEGITLRIAIAQIAELAAGFARINRDGNLTIASVGTTSVANITKSNYINFSNKEMALATIDKVVVKLGEEQSAAGTGSNPYYIVDNMFCQNPANVVTPIYNALNGLTYMPYSMKWQGNPAIYPGDKISIITDNATYTTILASRKLTYKGGLREEYKAPGKSNTEKNSTGKGNIQIKIQQYKSEIKVLRDSITQQVTMEEFNELGERVSTAETAITQHSTDISLKASKSEVNDISTRLTTAESKITDSAIVNTVTNSTEFSALNSQVQNLQSMGIGLKKDYSTFTTANGGELYLHGFNSNNIAADINGWINWNGSKVTITKGMINQNSSVPYDKPLYIFWSTSTNRLLVAYQDSSGAWKFNSADVAQTGANIGSSLNINSSTANSTFAIIGYFVQDTDESISFSTLFDKPLSFAELNQLANTYATKSEMQQTADSFTFKLSSNGGNNLLKNTVFKNGLQYWNKWGAPPTYTRGTSTSGYPYSLRIATNAGNQGASQSVSGLQVGVEYTVSAKINVVSGQPVLMAYNNGAYTRAYWDTSQGLNKWTEISYTYKPTSTTDTFYFGATASSGNTEFYITAVQLVRGNQRVAWTSNPDEVYEGITTIDADGITVTHSDAGGSYSKMSAGGFKWHNGSTSKDYHYLTYKGTGTINGSVTITLPAEFKGKEFEIALSIRGMDSGSANNPIYKTSLSVSSYDYVNGKFTITGTISSQKRSAIVTNKQNGYLVNYNGTITGMARDFLYDTVDFTYTSQAGSITFDYVAIA